ADIGTQSWNVRFVPKADSCTAAIGGTNACSANGFAFVPIGVAWAHGIGMVVELAVKRFLTLHLRPRLRGKGTPQFDRGRIARSSAHACAFQATLIAKRNGQGEQTAVV